ncbi:MAG: deoxyribodipyrimidine photo-lyase, partial [Cyanobacteria bacterium J06555_13]
MSVLPQTVSLKNDVLFVGLSMSTVQVVWLKKSFRLSDHPALTLAAKQGPVLPIYVVEPEYWMLPDTSYRQYMFLKGCVEELAVELEIIGGRLAIAQGNVLTVLQSLQKQFTHIDLWSHQETGNHWTFERDRSVRKWCKKNNVAFHEPLQFGVWRGSKIDRDHWAKHWDAFMVQPVASLPTEISFVEHSFNSPLPEPEELMLTH